MYRQIDTARYYRNEDQVGQAVKRCGIPRKEIFVSEFRPFRFVRWRNGLADLACLASKIYHPEHGYQQTLDAVDDSLRKFGHGTSVLGAVKVVVEMTDPRGRDRLLRPVPDPQPALRQGPPPRHLERALLDLQRTGKLHSAGVSH